MNSHKYRYKTAIEDKLIEHLKTESFESLGTLREELIQKIYGNVSMGAQHLGWAKIDYETFVEYFEVVRKEVQANYVTQIDESDVLAKDKETWLNEDRLERIEWNYTSRYLAHLRSEGRADKVLQEIDNSSLKILSRLADPMSQTPVFVKGLVDGDVQSGKTGNFNAVINRALDSGYRLVIVLSGIMDDLRKQTQDRIDKDVIGEGKKGVGEIQRFGHRGGSKVPQVVSVTSTEVDFSRPLADANFSLNQTNILVCKKNVSILKNILIWLYENRPDNEIKHSLPLLIIDDEADNASLNNLGHKGEQYASKINGYIRAILGLFHRKTYLGYTATPFANVIQDRNVESDFKWVVQTGTRAESKEISFNLVDNLFPDDFIILLKAPSNYVGAHLIFESYQENEKLPLVYEIDDHISDFPTRVLDHGEQIEGVKRFDSKQEWEDELGTFGSYLNFDSFQEYKRETRAAKAGDNFPTNVPESLKIAVICFILSIAVRDFRRKSLIESKLYQPHNTMLVHISRFTSWQNKTKYLLKAYYENELLPKLQMDKPIDSESIYRLFEKVWLDYYSEIIGSIEKYLPQNYADKFMAPVSFDSIQTTLLESAKNIDILAVNSSEKDKLDYDNKSPKKYIAIGGNRLSRGFTLEGLSINYFARSTNYSDSLLQMGRWFGYRPGYLDCCKLFTTKDLISKYDSTNLCIEELKEEFKKMEERTPPATPREFELRVRKHPGVLKITRPSILKNSTDVKWSFQDSLEMTTIFDVTKEKISKVWKNFIDEVCPLFVGAERKDSLDSLLVKKVSGHEIIQILDESNFDESQKALITKYINKCLEKNLLKSWSLAIKLTGNSSELKGLGPIRKENTGLEYDIQLAIRKGPTPDKTRFYKRLIEANRFHASGASANIMSGGKDMSVGLEDHEITQAEDQFVATKIKELMRKDSSLSESAAIEKARKISKPERIYRERLSRHEGILIIYLFDPLYVFTQLRGEENSAIKRILESRNQTLQHPLVGLAVGFPPIARSIDPCGEYVKGDYQLETPEEAEDGVSDDSLPLDLDVS